MRVCQLVIFNGCLSVSLKNNECHDQASNSHCSQNYPENDVSSRGDYKRAKLEKSAGTQKNYRVKVTWCVRVFINGNFLIQEVAKDHWLLAVWAFPSFSVFTTEFLLPVRTLEDLTQRSFSVIDTIGKCLRVSN